MNIIHDLGSLKRALSAHHDRLPLVVRVDGQAVNLSTDYQLRSEKNNDQPEVFVIELGHGEFQKLKDDLAAANEHRQNLLTASKEWGRERDNLQATNALLQSNLQFVRDQLEAASTEMAEAVKDQVQMVATLQAAKAELTKLNGSIATLAIIEVALQKAGAA